MSQPPSNLFLSIGRPVKDEYGRSVGKIICFSTAASGKIEAAFIEQSDGRFTKQPMEYLVFNGADVTFMSKIKTRATNFMDQIPFIWRKEKALKDLVDKKKIAPILYQELHTSFSAVLSQLRKDAQIIIDEAIQGITRCEEELSTLAYGVLYLELEHEIGKITDQAYQASFAQIQDTLRRTTSEKADLEVIKSKLTNILLGETPVVAEPKLPEQKTKVYAEKVPESTNTELPEPPVVVYVKEVGKTGI